MSLDQKRFYFSENQSQSIILVAWLKCKPISVNHDFLAANSRSLEDNCINQL